jgi:hypothetical protein
MRIRAAGGDRYRARDNVGKNWSVARVIRDCRKTQLSHLGRLRHLPSVMWRRAGWPVAALSPGILPPACQGGSLLPRPRNVQLQAQVSSDPRLERNRGDPLNFFTASDRRQFGSPYSAEDSAGHDPAQYSLDGLVVCLALAAASFTPPEGRKARVDSGSSARKDPRTDLSAKEVSAGGFLVDSFLRVRHPRFEGPSRPLCIYLRSHGDDERPHRG